jgi:Phage integrase family
VLVRTTVAQRFGTAQYVTRLFDQLRERAGLPKMTLHGTRHQQSSLQLAAGTPLAVVSKRLAHKNLAITPDLYSHLLRSTDHKAANNAAALVPARGASAHTLHTQPGGQDVEAVPVDIGRPCDLRKRLRARRDSNP